MDYSKTKVNNVVETIKEEKIEEFYFKTSVPEGYKLKLVKNDSITDSIYLTESEANEVLNKLHIRTDSLLFKTFKYDVYKELEAYKLIYYLHELGAVKDRFSKANATKEELVNAAVYLGRITKDSEIASLDFEGIQQEELYNILHNKHLEYYHKFKDLLLTDVISGS